MLLHSRGLVPQFDKAYSILMPKVPFSKELGTMGEEQLHQK